MIFSKIRNILEQKTFWIFLLPSLLVTLPMMVKLSEESWGLRPFPEGNWELENLIWWTLFTWSISVLMFCFGYGILLYKNRKTNAVLSFLQIFFIGSSIVTSAAEMHSHIILLVGAWVAFIMNLALSRKIES